VDDELPRLVGAHEIRSLLGVSRQRAYQLAARSDFPKPVAHLAQGKVWTCDEVEAWIDARRGRGRQGQRPRQVSGVRDDEDAAQPCAALRHLVGEGEGEGAGVGVGAGVTPSGAAVVRPSPGS
jgi:predicted DNA-binding transcriptional regulator AlpA